MRTVTLTLLSLLLAAPVGGQKVKREPLTDTQQEQIAEAGIDPVARVDLYVKFLNERADTIKGLTTRGHSSARSYRLDNELQDLTALMDELGTNLDLYSDRKADIRKSLKGLNESIQRWQSILNGLISEPGFELARRDALESSHDLSEQAKQLTSEQTAYFNLHKDEKGQDRAEPKD
jgi:uncharacterized membrane protein YgaE (UPF0421/DUF939 family)